MSNSGKFWYLVFSLGATVLSVGVSTAYAETITSPSYKIDGNFGGSFGGQTSSTSYKMSAIGGEAIVGNGSSGSYIIDQQHSSAQVQSMQLGIQPSGLVGYYPMDENTGTTTADASQYQNSGTFDGTPGWTTGKLGGAVSFSGANGERVTVPDNSNITMTNKMTLSLWANQSSATADKALASHWNYAGGPTSGGWALQTESTASRLQFFVANSPTDAGGNYIATQVGTWSTGGWHHIVVVYDGTKATASDRVAIYIDNVKVATTMAGTIPPTMQNAASPLMIGDFNGLNRTWNGSLDHVKLFSRALTSDEVAAEYTAQNAGIPTGASLNIASFAQSQEGGAEATLDVIVRTSETSYGLAVQQDHDLQSGSNTIPAFTGTIAEPVFWEIEYAGLYGLGFNVSSAPNLDSKWDSGWAYARFPNTPTTFYSTTNHSPGGIDVITMKARATVRDTQPAGKYINAITYTGTIIP